MQKERLGIRQHDCITPSFTILNGVPMCQFCSKLNNQPHQLTRQRSPELRILYPIRKRYTDMYEGCHIPKLDKQRAGIDAGLGCLSEVSECLDLTPFSSSCIQPPDSLDPGRQWRWLKQLSSWHSNERQVLSSWLLALVRPSPVLATVNIYEVNQGTGTLSHLSQIKTNKQTKKQPKTNKKFFTPSPSYNFKFVQDIYSHIWEQKRQ